MGKNFNKQIFSYLSIYGIVILLTLFSCKLKPSGEAASKHESLPEERNIVDVMVIQKGDFTREMVSNGKLAAVQKAQLWFKNGGIIATIQVRNGEQVARGAELGRLQNDDYLFALRKAEVNLEQAEINRLDALLGMGYKTFDDKILPDHLKIANSRSGYNQARIQLEEAQQQLAGATLVAPFSGKVEGLVQLPFEKADLSKPFCTLINDNRFTIAFSLLETEYAMVTKGQAVTVTPVNGAASANGAITEINPRIDENGLAWVKAEVSNPGGYIEGMNVKVSIKKTIPGQLVVPKQAVVLRDNREVLFRYTGTGTAYWTYIHVIDENENQYSVIPQDGARLESGDTVIVSNNLNLAHESTVTIK